MTIFGTRPEVIKLAPVISELEASPNFESVLVTTGQHREMLGQALDQFGIIPDYNLDIMQPDQGVSDVTISSLRGVEELISTEKPDLVLVQGDTTTAFAGCLAAFYQKTAVGHVEAGLRTYDKYKPFPEEINRSMITQLADIHFVPTVTAWESLRNEGIDVEKIFITGNTVIDALFQVLRPDYTFTDSALEGIGRHAGRLIVVTSHRRENFGQPLLDICAGLMEIIDRFEDVEIVFSVHRNPKVRVPVQSLLGDKERTHLVEPLDYADMANLLARCHLVMTDSGGLQEEAPALAKPVLVLRDLTERPEAVQSGQAKIVGTSKSAIIDAASDLLINDASYIAMTHGVSLYGDGKAASRIINAIEYVNGMRANKPAPFMSRLISPISGDQFLEEKPTSDALFYDQLDERIRRAKRERQRVSVAAIDMRETDKQQFAEAFRTITRSLRKTDTAAALDGKRMVLVLPGANGEQARVTTNRLLSNLSAPSLRRREEDRFGQLSASQARDLVKAVNVQIKTFEEDESATEIPEATKTDSGDYFRVGDVQR
ncbi:MAG: non-hydrolyzing UDP-N-acetylglucosamine 2-epimerase [Thermoleophilia bacterium]